MPHRKRISLPFLAILLVLLTSAASVAAQQATVLRQRALSRWGIGAGQYSGIAPLGNNRYAVVSDKEPADGFFIFRILQDGETGDVTSAALEGFYGNPTPTVDASGMSVRDCEGVAYFPKAQTLFISGEGDQQILEYALDGRPTGRRLTVPTIFSLKNIVPNYGFEALSYDSTTHRFWTTTESTLPADGAAAGSAHPEAQNILRLQAFDDELQPAGQWAYRMDRGHTEKFGKIYVYGVPEVTALPDGRLLVLEREANVPNGYLGAKVVCKLFLVNPSQGPQIDAATSLKTLDANHFLIKQLLATFTTRLTLFRHNFANYEGMCLGQPLADGRQTLLLICDSQGGYGRGPVHLKDYVRVVILPR